MRSRYSQITVIVLSAISDVFTNVTYILLSFALKAARKALFLCVINSSTSGKPKYILHSITMSLELVLKIFIRTLVTVNSSDLTSVRFTGHITNKVNT